MLDEAWEVDYKHNGVKKLFIHGDEDITISSFILFLWVQQTSDMILTWFHLNTNKNWCSFSFSINLSNKKLMDSKVIFKYASRLQLRCRVLLNSFQKAAEGCTIFPYCSLDREPRTSMYCIYYNWASVLFILIVLVSCWCCTNFLFCAFLCFVL